MDKLTKTKANMLRVGDLFREMVYFLRKKIMIIVLHDYFRLPTKLLELRMFSYYT